MDVQKAVRTSRKVQKTPHGHHVQTLVDVVTVEEEGVEEGVDVGADVSLTLLPCLPLSIPPCLTQMCFFSFLVTMIVHLSVNIIIMTHYR